MMDKLKAFSQTFGIHPLVAFSLFAIDWMLFSSEIVTIGSSWLVTVSRQTKLPTSSREPLATFVANGKESD